jgi:hypothetical protein
VDEFLELLKGAGLEVWSLEPKVDSRALAELRQGFPLDTRFQAKDERTNATSEAWVVAAPLKR